MINQSTLHANPGARKAKRIIGRGTGSGRGAFSGRGVKGAGSRSGFKTRPGFEGGQIPLMKRMPKYRGFNNPTRVSYQVVNVDALNAYEAGETVDIVRLFERKLISHKNRPIKILGNGDLSKKITVKVDAVSKSAEEKIKAQGGNILLLKKEPKQEAK